MNIIDPLLICSTLKKSNRWVKIYRIMCELKTKAFQAEAFLRGAVEYQEVAGAAAEFFFFKAKFLNFHFCFFLLLLRIGKVKEDAVVGS